MKPPRVSAKEVKILTLQQTQDLFAKNRSKVGDRDARYLGLLVGSRSKHSWAYGTFVASRRPLWFARER